MTHPRETQDHPSSPQRQRWALGALIAAASAAVVLSINAWAADEPAPPPMGPGMHAALMGGPGPGWDGMPFGGRHMQRLLDEAKVSDAQRTQIRAILDKAREDQRTMFEAGRALHEEGLKLWAAPQLDPQAIEKLRQQMQAHHDMVSKRMVQLMLDVGHVLTPEQRATMAQDMAKHRGDVRHRLHERRHGPRNMDRSASDATQRQPEGH